MQWTWVALLLAVIPVAAGHAQDVWVKSRNVNLTLRSGAGLEYRAVGGLKTGDAVKIVSRGDGWTQVRTNKGEEGWVTAGFLDPEAPAVVNLERLKVDARALKDEIATFKNETAALMKTNEKLTSQDEGQRSEIDRLTRENYELRAGARWPEWIAGGSIVLLGMALGAVLSRSSGRRQKRIRL
jgi:SH3 domain protein